MQDFHGTEFEMDAARVAFSRAAAEVIRAGMPVSCSCHLSYCVDYGQVKTVESEGSHSGSFWQVVGRREGGALRKSEAGSATTKWKSSTGID